MKLPLFRVYLLATMALLPGILHIFNWYLQNHYLEKSILLETNSSQEGKVNIDIWQDICSLSINSLRQFPLFPHFPNKRKFMIVSRDSIKFNFKGKFTAVRIMGYLHPTKTGYYVFYLTSPTLGQLWLSNTTEPMKAVRIAYTSLNIIKTLSFHVGDNKPVSEAIFLRRGSKYYFEILHALNDPIQQNREVILYWMLPGTALFTNITGNHVSEYSELLSFYKTPETFEEEDENEDDILPPSLKLFEDEDKPLREVYPLDKERTKKSKMPIFTLKQDYIKAILGSNLDLDVTEYNRETVRILPYMDRNKNDVIDAFPNCKYDPTYYTKSWNVSRYEGIKKSVFVDIFPSDETNLMRFGPVLKENHVHANDVIKEKDVVQLVKYFMDELNKNSGRIYLLHSITNIEQYSPKELKGGKYLLELVLRTRESDKLYRFSEFFFQKMNQTRPSLCFLENMRWKTNVWINVILNASGQSGWVVYYVKQMARILKETHDDHVTFIIVDYGNDRIDIGKEMIRSISMYTVL